MARNNHSLPSRASGLPWMIRKLIEQGNQESFGTGVACPSVRREQERNSVRRLRSRNPRVGPVPDRRIFAAEARSRRCRGLRRRQSPAQPRPIHFVFHSGFCCSTLFAGCFDQPGLATTFSEPMILNDVVGWRNAARAGRCRALARRRLVAARAALRWRPGGDREAIDRGQRPGRGDDRPPAARPGRSSCMRRSDDFLTSIAKKGLDGRLWVRELFLAMRREGLLEGSGSPTSRLFRSDRSARSPAWPGLAQQRLFAELIAAYPERVRSLDSESFLAKPRGGVSGGRRLFAFKCRIRACGADGTRRPLARNSKDGKAYSRGARKAEYQSALQALMATKLRRSRTWAGKWRRGRPGSAHASQSTAIKKGGSEDPPQICDCDPKLRTSGGPSPQ